MKPLIAIGLGTRDRPEMLKEALNSLINIHLPEEVDVLLIVCDNGSTDESFKVVQNLEEKTPFKVSYLKEERQGIAYMRNRILEKALDEKATYLAFFDDDETVDEDWLVELTNARIKYSAHVVQGRLEQKFPEISDSKIVKKFFPGDFNKNSGDDLNEAYTGNVIMDISFVVSNNLRFNHRFNLTGGSDSYFFRQMKKNGARIVYCKEAVATETIPESRASINWILSRFYRNGYTKYLMDVADYGKYKAFWMGFLYVFKSVKTCISVTFSSHKSIDEIKMKKLNRCLRAKGVLHAMFGVPFEEYTSIHGK
ncbi:glycosyltransferase family 2 protein [Ekhidna sp.]|uniref:glycosyltransferase family 2 protein n=1 Tax=Ekhidna sp. TaxID=2608089 RepID=UPI003CCB846C